MRKKIHILVTSELGNVRPYTFCRKKLKVSILVSTVFIISATIGSIFYFSKSNELTTEVRALNQELVAVKQNNVQLNEKVAQLEYTVEEPLKTAVSELTERSQVIQAILNFVGVEIVPAEENDGDSQGGPFIQLPADGLDTLILETDNYLDAIQTIPLGYPTNGKISSRFGRRRDPFTKKPAMHHGIDIKNKSGTKIYATADGIVKKSQRDSKYGRYVRIDHGNGFETIYGHNKKLLVNKGEKVKRGQVIALMGNSGRSTGPHVHYELKFEKNVIDPIKYMKVASQFKKQS